MTSSPLAAMRKARDQRERTRLHARTSAVINAAIHARDADVAGRIIGDAIGLRDVVATCDPAWFPGIERNLDRLLRDVPPAGEA